MMKIRNITILYIPYKAICGEPGARLARTMAVWRFDNTIKITISHDPDHRLFQVKAFISMRILTKSGQPRS